MVRLGIISDSHIMPKDALVRVAEVLKLERAQRLICLGDGQRDAKLLSELLGIELICVAGNCDPACDAQEMTLVLEGVKLLICHGHRLQVKSSLIRLMLRAEELGCQVALFGHTHRAMAEWREGTLFLNPGALKDGCFAVLELSDGRATYALHGHDVEKFL